MRTTDVLEELQRLPMRPSAVTQVLTVLDDSNASAHDIASALQSDPSLTARILQLANSPYFGLSGKIGSLDRAVVALGASVIRSLAVSTAAGMFGGKDEMPEGFWHHSVAVAAGASIAARIASVPAGDALCAGLLHDLGAALLFRFDPDGWIEHTATGDDLVAMLDREAAHYGGNHASIGAFALDAWKLPVSIVEAIRLHHKDPVDVADKLARVVIAGEALAHAARPDAPFARHETGVEPEAAFRALGLTAVHIEGLVQRTGEEAEALDGLLGAR